MSSCNDAAAFSDCSSAAVCRTYACFLGFIAPIPLVNPMRRLRSDDDEDDDEDEDELELDDELDDEELDELEEELELEEDEELEELDDELELESSHLLQVLILYFIPIPH